MSRLVVVSNRVALPSATRAGGLAVAMHAALAEQGGVWFGWSGRTRTGERGKRGKRALHLQRRGRVTYATLDLDKHDYDQYYAGFANRSLWPLLHFRPALVHFERETWAGYLRVNEEFAERLMEILEPGDLIWVHDYHLIPLAAALRRLGVHARMGFFLHTPLPPPDLLLMLPVHRELFEALGAYDLVGFHIERYRRAFRDYILHEAHGEMNEQGVISVRGGRRSFRAGVFPIGIDTAEIARLAAAAPASASFRQLERSLRGRALVVGVDRLDYSKGLYERFEAFARTMKEYPEFRRKVTLLQIAPPSRGEVPEYREIRRELEGLAGAINGRLAEPDWNPIRYVNKTYGQAALAGFYRLARVGLVTPLRDGMNLVAMEYVASQDPEDPGVLVLSRFAGAAEVMDGALLVNPHDGEAMVQGMRAALTMSLADRKARWHSMMARLRAYDITAWRRDYLAALGGNR